MTCKVKWVYMLFNASAHARNGKMFVSLDFHLRLPFNLHFMRVNWAGLTVCPNYGHMLTIYPNYGHMLTTYPNYGQFVYLMFFGPRHSCFDHFSMIPSDIVLATVCLSFYSRYPTAFAYLTFLACALDAWTSFAFASHVWIRFHLTA